MAFTPVYNVGNVVNQTSRKGLFDTDASFVVCNNSSNTHIFNDCNMFVTFESTSSDMVANIGNKTNIPSGIER